MDVRSHGASNLEGSMKIKIRTRFSIGMLVIKNNRCMICVVNSLYYEMKSMDSIEKLKHTGRMKNGKGC